MNELISVIVPVYKAEPYLGKCLDSILAQTYQNLEIILVDDGSPDRSGAICDEYARRDSRLKVIHRENGGVSEARNTGLDVATGEYIGFVDSDDWIEPNMYAELLRAALEYRADMAICCVEKIRKDGVFTQDIGHTRVYSRQKALYELICDKNVTSFSVNKLFHRELFQDLRFQKGKRVFEDTLFMYQIFDRITRAVHIDLVGYHYLRRDDSALGTWPVTVEVEFCLTQQDRYRDLSVKHPELKPIMLKKYVALFWMMRGDFLAQKCEEPQLCAEKIQKEVAPFAHSFVSEFRKYSNLSRVKELSLRFFLCAPTFYRKLYLQIKKH